MVENNAVLSGAALLPGCQQTEDPVQSQTISRSNLSQFCRAPVTHCCFDVLPTAGYVRLARMMRMLRLLHPPAVSALRCCLGLCNVERPTNPSIWCLLRVSPPRLEIPLCAATREDKRIKDVSVVVVFKYLRQPCDQCTIMHKSCRIL